MDKSRFDDSGWRTPVERSLRRSHSNTHRYLTPLWFGFTRSPFQIRTAVPADRTISCRLLDERAGHIPPQTRPAVATRALLRCWSARILQTAGFENSIHPLQIDQMVQHGYGEECIRDQIVWNGQYEEYVAFGSHPQSTRLYRRHRRRRLHHRYRTRHRRRCPSLRRHFIPAYRSHAASPPTRVFTRSISTMSG